MKETRRQPSLGRTRHVHMVGIGGIGMSSIAEVLLSRGYHVSGSDLVTSETTEHLVELGAQISKGHAAENISDADVVVYSSAVDPSSNPETRAAEKRRIPTIKRADMLGELMRMQFGVAIAGTHGKTTTTSMAGTVVAGGGFDPTVIVGGKVAVFGSNAVVGKGDIIVIEADEYDRTFLRLTPSIAVITSIDAEHLDIYAGLEDLKNSFVQFANSIPFFGAAIVCLDDPNVQSIVGQLDRRVVTYGLSRQAAVRADNVARDGLTTTFDVIVHDSNPTRLEIQVPGIHNVRNALAAFAVGLELDIPADEITAALNRFSGVRRRFEVLSTANDIMIVDDYAHHPVEVEATLAAASQAWPKRRLIAVFQPHLYSRTVDFKDEFAKAFRDADILILTDVYGAREEPIEGVDGSVLAKLARQYGHSDVRYVPSVHDLPQTVKRVATSGDAVIFMGAGDIWRSTRKLADELGSTERQ